MQRKDKVVDTSESRAFYDGFLEERMLAYRLHANRRLSMAGRFALEHTRKSSRILEIGCGIGVVTEKLARKASGGRIWACDLSKRNVDFARSTVERDNIDFFVCDVLNELETIADRVDRPDRLLMVDVLEHLPRDQHPSLFARFGELLAPEAKIILTFPTPEFQRLLTENAPEKLQPVDEMIDADHISALAAAAGMRVKIFLRRDVWRTSQYIHCVLSRGSVLNDVERSFSERILGWLQGIYWRMVQRPLRQRSISRLLRG